jgi:hypothetical protein
MVTGVPFEFFCVLMIALAVCLYYGFTSRSVAAFLAGAGLMFFIGVFTGSQGIIMLDSTLYTTTNSILIANFSLAMIYASIGLIPFSMVVAISD